MYQHKPARILFKQYNRAFSYVPWFAEILPTFMPKPMVELAHTWRPEGRTVGTLQH